MAKMTEIEKAIMKCVRFARVPVSVIKMNDFAGRFVQTGRVTFRQDETIAAIEKLVAAKKLLRTGNGAFGSVMLAW